MDSCDGFVRTVTNGIIDIVSRTRGNETRDKAARDTRTKERSSKLLNYTARFYLHGRKFPSSSRDWLGFFENCFPVRLTVNRERTESSSDWNFASFSNGEKKVFGRLVISVELNPSIRNSRSPFATADANIYVFFFFFFFWEWGKLEQIFFWNSSTYL